MAVITRAKCQVVLLSETKGIDRIDGNEVYTYLFESVPNIENTQILRNAGVDATSQTSTQQHIANAKLAASQTNQSTQSAPKGDSMKNLGNNEPRLMQPISFQFSEPGLFEIGQPYWLEVQQG